MGEVITTDLLKCTGRKQHHRHILFRFFLLFYFHTSYQHTYKTHTDTTVQQVEARVHPLSITPEPPSTMIVAEERDGISIPAMIIEEQNIESRHHTFTTTTTTTTTTLTTATTTTATTTTIKAGAFCLIAITRTQLKLKSMIFFATNLN